MVCRAGPSGGPGSRGRAAFTLVELLVVIGIIAVLVAILLPSLNKARAQATQTTCLSQMRQLGIALVIYTSANKGQLPVQPADRVYDFMSQAVTDSSDVNNRTVLGTLMQNMEGASKVLVCPNAGDIPWVAQWSPTKDSDTSYMINAAVCDLPLARVQRAAEVIMIQEDRFRWQVAWARPVRGGSNPPVYSAWCFENGSLGQEYGNVHPKDQKSGAGNLLFADGHGERRRHRDLHARDFGLTGGPGVSGDENDPNTVDQGRSYRAMFE